MKMKIAILLTLLTLLGTVPIGAADGDGGYAGAFYQVPLGARPTAMGGAYRSLSNDGAGPLYNPAGLAGLQSILFSSSYRAMQLDRQVGYVTLMFPARGNSALGAHWRYAGSGSVDVRNADGDKLGRDISMNNYDFSIVFAKRFTGPFAAGIKMYYLHSSFADMSAFSVGFDFGFMLYLDHLLHERGESDGSGLRDIQVGLTLKYFEAKYSWKNEEYLLRHVDGGSFGTEQIDKIPMEVGLGASARLLDRRLIVATDLVKNSKQGVDLHLGSEYFVKPEFALRAGFSGGRFTVGTGYLFNLADRVLGIDYAFSTDRVDEGSEHIFSFELLF